MGEGFLVSHVVLVFALVFCVVVLRWFLVLTYVSWPWSPGPFLGVSFVARGRPHIPPPADDDLLPLPLDLCQTSTKRGLFFGCFRNHAIAISTWPVISTVSTAPVSIKRSPNPFFTTHPHMCVYAVHASERNNPF